MTGYVAARLVFHVHGGREDSWDGHCLQLCGSGKATSILWALLSPCAKQRDLPHIPHGTIERIKWENTSGGILLLSNPFQGNHVRPFCKHRGHRWADQSALINTWPTAGSQLHEQGAEVSHPMSNIHFLSFLSSWLNCQTKLLDTFHSAPAQKASHHSLWLWKWILSLLLTSSIPRNMPLGICLR